MILGITGEELRIVGKVFSAWLGFMGPAKNTLVFYYVKN